MMTMTENRFALIGASRTGIPWLIILKKPGTRRSISGIAPLLALTGRENMSIFNNVLPTLDYFRKILTGLLLPSVMTLFRRLPGI